MEDFMKRKYMLIIGLLLITNLLFGNVVLASNNDNLIYKDIQFKIIQDIEKSLESKQVDEITRGLSYSKNKEIIIDLRYDMNSIKLSLLEPLTIYEEVIIKRYDYNDKLNSSKTTASYETRTINTSRTYNGTTTTVNSTIGYYVEEEVILGGAVTDAFRLRTSNISFNGDGYGHISRIYAKHHQRGADLNNKYQIVYDGNANSSDRTNESFSMYQTTGQANWNKYNSTYSALVRPGYTGGFVGTFYTVEFIWDLGGGHYGYDTLERTNGFGALPS